MQKKINREFKNAIKKFGNKYFIQERLQPNKIIQDIEKYDQDLLEALMTNKTIKDNFTIDIKGNTVIQVDQLIEFFKGDEFWQNAYTAYDHKIGLTVNGKFIDESADVVLDFPYKDTLLKASMSHEDTDEGQLMSEESFLNESIAKEEINILLDKKILIHAKKYCEQGVEDIAQFHPADNLIIKGNNLLALHTLKEKYRGKVKFIYIDPPYLFGDQKRSTAFSYHTNFKTSTWLTFMKNRLEIAREFLADDGAIFVSISNYGQAYLKLLMDDIFGQKNYIDTFIWKNTDNADSLGMKSRVTIEFIHAYEKVYQPKKKWRGRLSANDDAPLLNASNSVGVLNFPKGTIHFKIPDGTYGKGKYPSLEVMTDLEVKDGKNVNEVALKGKFKWGQENLERQIKAGTYFLIKSNRFSIRYQKLEASIMAPEKYIDQVYLSKAIGVGTNEDSQSHLKQMGIHFTYSKPESLIAFLMQSVTEEKDLIMDFFMGSGTTQAVAHKMNRQYIGIEQMDYIHTDTVPRLQKVIEGEQGGISKNYNWQGGGSFVYAELMEKNIGFVKKIRSAKDHNDLWEIIILLVEEAELDLKAELEKVKEILPELTLEDQKRLLMKTIDPHQFYYNYSEIDGEIVRELITQHDYQFNKSFYEGSGD